MSNAMNKAVKTAKQVEATKKDIDRSMTAPKVKAFTLEEYEAMLDADRAKWGNTSDWYEGSSNENA